MRFEVTDTQGNPIGGARVRVGRTHIETDPNGKASARIVVRHPGRKRATVRAVGFRPAHASFRAVRRR